MSQTRLLFCCVTPTFLPRDPGLTGLFAPPKEDSTPELRQPWQFYVRVNRKPSLPQQLAGQLPVKSARFYEAFSCVSYASGALWVSAKFDL